jgi:hypothetical protein
MNKQSQLRLCWWCNQPMKQTDRTTVLVHGDKVTVHVACSVDAEEENHTHTVYVPPEDGRTPPAYEGYDDE